MNYKPTRYSDVFITGVGHYLPGEPIDNETMDEYIAPVNRLSSRIKRKILADNGIKSRHYAINKSGESTSSAASMAASAINESLAHAGQKLSETTLLGTGSGGGDVLMPGFANMLQGELGAPPMETRSHHGICASGVHALKDIANLIQNGSHKKAVHCAVEYPSRLFKKSRYTSNQYDLDFDAHFLRWMLSDGAGACSVSSTPDSSSGLALRIDWIHSKSFSGDYPVCMQLGGGISGEESFLDAASFREAEENGLLLVRQNIRLLPQLFEVATHEYTELVKQGYVKPQEVDHFLCHYSSEKLGDVANELMQKAGLAIDRSKWYSNLSTRGNTGSAAIFIMLSEFCKSRQLKAGERIFCFIPESGRFTVSYMMLSVVESSTTSQHGESLIKITPPHNPESSDSPIVKQTLHELASIWHQYRSDVWRTLLVQKIIKQQMDTTAYLKWMESWIPQVREGSKWMRTAIEHLPSQYRDLAHLIETHASEEQDDYNILFEDYRSLGGEIEDIDQLKRNPGGEALNAYMYSIACSDNPIGLLGGIYIIEGTGQRIIPALLPLIRQQLPVNMGFRFLTYHGENDIEHLSRWLTATTMVLDIDDKEQALSNSKAIIRTAKDIAQLYQLQWEMVYE